MECSLNVEVKRRIEIWRQLLAAEAHGLSYLGVLLNRCGDLASYSYYLHLTLGLYEHGVWCSVGEIVSISKKLKRMRLL
jgi:dTDP-4-amino-4,6-dideoxygalactose transaminase